MTNLRRRAVLRWLGGVAVGGLVPLGAVPGDTDASLTARQIPVWRMPEALWALLARAQAIQTGAPGLPAQLQVLVDVNCPYCARTYTRFHTYYPSLAVRWVPIAALLPDSGPIADAILRSRDPVASLTQNYLHYRYAGIHSHGGFALPRDGRHYALPVANQAVQRSWAQWSHRTPTFVFRDRERRITAVADATWTAIRYVVGDVSPAMGTYRP